MTYGRALTRSECGEAGITARLLREDWTEMTKAALSSANHVSRIERWERIARETNPALDDEQVGRLAETLRRNHYRRMGRLSVAARKGAQK